VEQRKEQGRDEKLQREVQESLAVCNALRDKQKQLLARSVALPPNMTFRSPGFGGVPRHPGPTVLPPPGGHVLA